MTWFDVSTASPQSATAICALIDIDGEITTAVNLVVENRRITRIYPIRNPNKLARLDEVAALTRT